MAVTFNDGDWVWHEKHGVGQVGLSTEQEILVEFEAGGEEVFEAGPRKKIALNLLSPEGFWLMKRNSREAFAAKVRETPLEALAAFLRDQKTEFDAGELKAAVAPDLIPDEEWEDWYTRLVQAAKADPRFEVDKNGDIAYRGELGDIAGDLIARFKQAHSLKDKNRVVKEMLQLEQKGVPLDDVRETAVSFFTGTNVSRTNKMGARLEALIFLEELDTVQHKMLAGPLHDEIRALTAEQAAEAAAETNETPVRLALFSLIHDLKPAEFIEICRMLTKRFKKLQRDWTLDTLLEFDDKSYIKDITGATVCDIATNKQPFVWIFKSLLEKSEALAAVGLAADQVINLAFKTLNNIHFTSVFSSNPKEGLSITREEDEMVKLLKNEKKIFEFLAGQPKNILSLFGTRYRDCLAIENEIREEFVKKLAVKYPDVELKEEEIVEDENATKLTRDTYERFHREYRDLVDDRIPEATRYIATAREFGDISENAELIIAQEKQRMLIGRKNELERIFENCIVIDNAG